MALASATTRRRRSTKLSRSITICTQRCRRSRG
ncbi:hypothetical protein COLO4_19985 [Corchorus olitorius]|uniref:Uncharacterized protein n=1 Tax=Corchorus olitorius TaxID=93759 RepID=A0A1R3J2D6_9ROSI|nr:hypothetical protein COLO4_19985 [Corchorus olitorius]